MRWTLLRTPPLLAAENMAIDELLLERAARTGEGVFRVYSWGEPTLSFGRNQTAVGVYDTSRARNRGVAVVRRLTGGRALLHHREVTYSVTAPLATATSLRESYARINRLLVYGLRRLGVAVEVAAPKDRAVAPSASPCFERPAAGELVVDGRKLVGSAQWRDGHAMLQHGSILIEDDQPLVSELAMVPVPDPRPAATLAESLGRVPSFDEVATALFDAVRSHECEDAAEMDMNSTVDTASRALGRYNDDTWTWRR
jgi:lipoyl(octanoyl) transferase